MFVFAGIWNFYRGEPKRFCKVSDEVEGCYFDEKLIYKEIKKNMG